MFVKTLKRLFLKSQKNNHNIVVEIAFILFVCNFSVFSEVICWDASKNDLFKAPTSENFLPKNGYACKY